MIAPSFSPPEDQDAGKLRITSSSVYNAIMMFMLREAEGIFRRHLGMQAPGGAAAAAGGSGEQGALRPIKETDLTKNGRWVQRGVGKVASGRGRVGSTGRAGGSCCGGLQEAPEHASARGGSSRGERGDGGAAAGQGDGPHQERQVRVQRGVVGRGAGRWDGGGSGRVGWWGGAEGWRACSSGKGSSRGKQQQGARSGGR